MTFIDSSFAIEWLLGRSRANSIPLEGGSCGMLGHQYAEILIFFLKAGKKGEEVSQQLEYFEFMAAEKEEWKDAGELYLKARKEKSKASLADAVLASVVIRRREKLLSFDQDFKSLNLKETGGGVWVAHPARF